MDNNVLTQLSSSVIEAQEWLSNHVEYKHILEQLLNKLVDTLIENDVENEFFEEVTDDDVPGYSNLVKHPICLKTIQNKVRKNHYKTLDEFKKDVSICVL